MSDHDLLPGVVPLDGRQTSGRKGLAYPWFDVMLDELTPRGVTELTEPTPGAAIRSAATPGTLIPIG